MKFIRKPLRSRCIVRKCKNLSVVNGYCCEHYIKMLDKFEAKSRKTKLVAGRKEILY